jgi:hypothetical protein
MRIEDGLVDRAVGSTASQSLKAVSSSQLQRCEANININIFLVIPKSPQRNIYNEGADHKDTISRLCWQVGINEVWTHYS